MSLELVIERVYRRHLRLHSLCQRSRFCYNLTFSGFVNVPGQCRNQQCRKNCQNHQYNNKFDKCKPAFRILVQWTVYNNGKGYIGIYCGDDGKTDVFKESKVKGYAYYGYYLGKIVYCINENDPTWTKNTVYNWMGIE